MLAGCGITVTDTTHERHADLARFHPIKQDRLIRCDTLLAVDAMALLDIVDGIFLGPGNNKKTPFSQRLKPGMIQIIAVADNDAGRWELKAASDGKIGRMAMSDLPGLHPGCLVANFTEGGIIVSRAC